MAASALAARLWPFPARLRQPGGVAGEPAVPDRFLADRRGAAAENAQPRSAPEPKAEAAVSATASLPGTRASGQQPRAMMTTT
jgi:hypothetical protein